MLQTLKIENFALIKNLTVEFKEGLNVLLGETGAGKSLIFNGLLFALGEKADKNFVRMGENLMRVDALFVDINNEAKNFLKDSGYEYEGELLLSRTLTSEGKSTARINGMMATSSILKELSKFLVDSFAQHENVELLNYKNHIVLLDKFAEKDEQEVKNNLAILFDQVKEIDRQISALGGDENDRERTISLLKYQYDEINEAALRDGEDEEIKERLKVLNNSEKIYEVVSLCENLLCDNSISVISQLQEASSQLNSLSSINEILDLKNRLDSARYEIEDIESTLVDIKGNTLYDENELESLEKRYDLIKTLCRKYGGSITAVLEFASKTKEKIALLEDGEFMLNKLSKQREILYNQMKEQAAQLSKIRKKASKFIEIKVAEQLKDLGMKSARFEVEILPLPEISLNGNDDVRFNFSANAGQEVKSFAKTVSGGELSRFMLAVKNIMAEGRASTLLFDEIDSGISGQVGKIVGQKLKNISKSSQVICITHLPQVASFGNNFINVFKNEENGETFSHIKILSGQEVVEAIAKMISGADITQTALTHAKEILIESQSY